MLLSHLIHNFALDTATECFTFIKGTHETLLSRLLQVLNMMSLVLTFEELMQKLESIALLH